MALPMVTAAVTLFYLGAIPIHLAFCIHLGANSRFGAGISAFEPRFALQKAHQRQNGQGKIPAFVKNIDWKSAIRAGLEMMKSLSSHVHLEDVRLEGRFGSDDAALTALVCGGLTALGNTLRCVLSRSVKINLIPDFSGGPLRAELNGMISVRVGHIMLAALLGAFQYGTRRFKKWTSIPSKAS